MPFPIMTTSFVVVDMSAYAGVIYFLFIDLLCYSQFCFVYELELRLYFRCLQVFAFCAIGGALFVFIA